MIECNICYKTFDKPYDYKRHIKKKCYNIDINKLQESKLKENLQCKFCFKKFGTIFNLKRHLNNPKISCYINNNSIFNNADKEVSEKKKYKRKKINQSTRIKVAASQLWKCKQCEMIFNEGGWDINHIVRVSLGGSNKLSNLEALCKNCHGIITTNERIRDGF
jgi:5-methylcytosine-specific restriction endonuclease McrA